MSKKTGAPAGLPEGAHAANAPGTSIEPVAPATDLGANRSPLSASLSTSCPPAGARTVRVVRKTALLDPRVLTRLCYPDWFEGVLAQCQVQGKKVCEPMFLDSILAQLRAARAPVEVYHAVACAGFTAAGPDSTMDDTLIRALILQSRHYHPLSTARLVEQRLTKATENSNPWKFNARQVAHLFLRIETLAADPDSSRNPDTTHAPLADHLRRVFADVAARAALHHPEEWQASVLIHAARHWLAKAQVDARRTPVWMTLIGSIEQVLMKGHPSNPSSRSGIFNFLFDHLLMQASVSQNNPEACLVPLLLGMLPDDRARSLAEAEIVLKPLVLERLCQALPADGSAAFGPPSPASPLTH